MKQCWKRSGGAGSHWVMFRNPVNPAKDDWDRMFLKWLKRVRRTARSPHPWVILALLVLCTIHHYPEQIGLSALLSSISPDSPFGLIRHAGDRVFYLLPVVYAGYVFGAKTGLAMASIALWSTCSAVSWSSFSRRPRRSIIITPLNLPSASIPKYSSWSTFPSPSGGKTGFARGPW